MSKQLEDVTAVLEALMPLAARVEDAEVGRILAQCGYELIRLGAAEMFKMGVESGNGGLIAGAAGVEVMLRTATATPPPATPTPLDDNGTDGQT